MLHKQLSLEKQSLLKLLKNNLKFFNIIKATFGSLFFGPFETLDYKPFGITLTTKSGFNRFSLL